MCWLIPAQRGLQQAATGLFCLGDLLESAAYNYMACASHDKEYTWLPQVSWDIVRQTLPASARSVEALSSYRCSIHC